MGLRGTTAPLPQKCSLSKRTRFGLFIQNLSICFCTASSTYLEHIWLTLPQKAAVQHVCVCISVQEIPGRNMTSSSWLLPSIYKHYGEIHRLTRFKISRLRRCLPALYVFQNVMWGDLCRVLKVLKYFSVIPSDGPSICIHTSSSEFSQNTWRISSYKLVCYDSEQCVSADSCPSIHTSFHYLHLKSS